MIALNSILAESDLTDLFKPVAALLAVIIVLIVAVQVLRRWMASHGADDHTAGGFTLASLRQLVKDGKMTQEEYDRAKSQIVAATQRATEQRAAEQARQREGARNQPSITLPPDMKHPNDPDTD